MELLIRSRQCEIEADELSCRWTSRDSVARALTLVIGCSALLEAKIFKPFEAELLGAIAIPTSPIIRIVEGRDGLVLQAEMTQYAAEAYESEAEPNSTHPTLKQRLTSIGALSIPDLAIRASAAASLLSPAKLNELISDLDRQAQRYAEARIEGSTLVHF